MAKACCICNTEKDPSEFYNNKTRPDGKTYECKDCWKDIIRARTYGLEAGQYDQMYAAQGGGCAICTTEHEVLAVDHDHETGAIRGLLCQTCNVGLGNFKDNDLLLKAAAEYL